ncbi:MAG: NAD-glutamate dehydrogenase domain-containing protein [Desulfovibrio sp.]
MAAQSSAVELFTGKVMDHAGAAMEDIIPWFLDNMPPYYFKSYSEDEQIRHVQAFLSSMSSENRQSVVLKSPCGNKITYITPDTEVNLRGDYLNSIRIFYTKDRSFRVETYVFGSHTSCSLYEQTYQQALSRLHKQATGGFDDLVDAESFLKGATYEFATHLESDRAKNSYERCRKVLGTQHVHVGFEEQLEDELDCVSIGMTGHLHTFHLEQIYQVFRNEGLEPQRVFGDVFHMDDEEYVTLIQVYLEHSTGGICNNKAVCARLSMQLETVKWLTQHSLDTFERDEGFSLNKIMLLQAALNFAHQFLLRRNIYIYTMQEITEMAMEYREYVVTFIQYFEEKFDPDKYSPEEMDKRIAAMQAMENNIEEKLNAISDEIIRNTLRYMFYLFKYTLRTNYYVKHPCGLSFRVDRDFPGFEVEGQERPFGVYYFHGPRFTGFHVRYRDMARGGVRLVRTRSREHFKLESKRLYSEVTKLASSQQFKNKDIPEGGSKAVMLIQPMGDPNLVVESMINSLLDLLVSEDDSKAHTMPRVVDHLNREEIIYLGPDENITPKHIKWIVSHAVNRGYRWPNAFMSSKLKAGINHKVYGVTSEGVVVFAEELLRFVGIDPSTEPFTVKLTGGPAGDVASNVIKIMMREYRPNVNIVSMSDGHGACYDPKGLDTSELMRLIENGGRCHDFNPALIKSPDGFVVSADTMEGAAVRDALHNNVKADIFIPAGGRPDTINAKNWKQFLQPSGEPSALAIVEGANIFISDEARDHLEAAGVAFIPGPSANKTGVICSSYEILAGLILDDDEFLEIKTDYIDEVLDILRVRARSEARLLLHEYKMRGMKVPLSELSYAISTTINSLGDIISKYLHERFDCEDAGCDSMHKDKALRKLLLDYCPAVLATGYPERVVEETPLAHRIAVIASYMASSLVYEEGVRWVSNIMDVEDINRFIYTYLEQGDKVNRLIAILDKSDVEEKDVILSVLRDSGRKQLTLSRLGLG